MKSLYECQNAKVLGNLIYCAAGHKLNNQPLTLKSLSKGRPLIFEACQDCLDFDCNGEPVDRKDRGWVKR